MSYSSKNVVLVIMCVGSLTGCGVLGGHTGVDHLKNANASVLSYEAESRGAYFATSQEPLRYCAEPPPDVALDRSLKLAGELTAKTQGVEGAAKANAEVASKAVELAGRTQLVLLAREFLYRTCELRLNGEEVDIENNYNKIIDLISALGKAELQSVEAERVEQEKGRLKEENENFRLQNLIEK